MPLKALDALESPLYVAISVCGYFMQYNSTATSIANQWSTASGESKQQQADSGGGGSFGRRLSEGGGGDAMFGIEGLFHHDPDAQEAGSAGEVQSKRHHRDKDPSLLTAEERWLLSTGEA